MKTSAAKTNKKASAADLGFLSGGGEIGKLIRKTDWSKTALGPAEGWPAEVKAVLGVILSTLESQQATAAKEKSEFLINISHDIRTPMNAIVGLASILSETSGTDSKQKQIASTLKSSTDHLLEMVNSLLDLTNLEENARPKTEEKQSKKRIEKDSAQLSMLGEQAQRILLVEDYSANILVASTIIESLGYKCDVAKCGTEALQRFADEQYAIILMDVQLPDIDGMETTRRIRQLEKQKSMPATPIIAMTAHASDNDKEKCLKAGMSDYMPKPFNPNDLTRKLKHHIKVCS